MDKVSEYIKQQREARNVTLEELSKATLISVATLKDIELGKFDKYRGDEPYVKMYLKKIAKFLELETNEISELLDNYAALTQEIELLHLQEEQERMRVLEEHKKNAKIGDKLGETIKEVKASKTLSSRRRKHVYEDNFLARYFKYGVIVLLCAGIVFVIWYSLTTATSNNSEPDKPVEPEIEQNQDEINKQKEKEEQEKKQEKKQEEEVKQPEVPPFSITNTERSSFDISGIKEGDPVKIEVTFAADSRFNLWINNSQYDGAYGEYTANQTYTYEGTFTSGRNYLFNIWQYENVVIKVNGVIVKYDANNIEVKDGVSYFRFHMKGE